MGRNYAGTLGCLAFATCLVRGMIGSVGFESALGTAMVCLLVFSILGALIGMLADWIVRDSIQTNITKQMNADLTVQAAVAAPTTIQPV